MRWTYDCLIYLPEISSPVLNRNNQMSILIFIVIWEGGGNGTFHLSPFNILLAVDSSEMPFTNWGHCILFLFYWIINKGCWTLSNVSSAAIKWLFSLSFLLIRYIKLIFLLNPPFYSRDKFYLIMVYNPFNMLLDSVY